MTGPVSTVFPFGGSGWFQCALLHHQTPLKLVEDYRLPRGRKQTLAVRHPRTLAGTALLLSPTRSLVSFCRKGSTAEMHISTRASRMSHLGSAEECPEKVRQKANEMSFGGPNGLSRLQNRRGLDQLHLAASDGS